MKWNTRNYTRLFSLVFVENVYFEYELIEYVLIFFVNLPVNIYDDNAIRKKVRTTLYLFQIWVGKI